MISGDLSKLLADVSADQLSIYLDLRGWRKDADLGDMASVWHRPESQHEEAEVLMPSFQHRAKDFGRRLVDAVTAIALFEGRPLVDIVRDITGCFSDRIRVRVFHPDVEDGAIPLDDGVLLNQRARDLMEAAALASASKRRQFSGRKPEEISEYLSSLRLGQTEIGSYVVNVLAPLPRQTTQQLKLPSISVSQVVTATLSSGLQALDEAIDTIARGGKQSVLDAAVNNGASANMCDALVGLSGAGRQRGFEVTVISAGSGGEINPQLTFVFDREKVEHVAEASLYYKQEDYTLYGRTITGSVEKLDRPLADETGIVTIAAILNDQQKNVSVELDKADYQQAVFAHGEKLLVQCHGDVRVTTRTARMVNLAHFKVIKNGDLPGLS